MTQDDLDFLRDFFRNLTDRPIEPDDPRYVPLYEDETLAPADPVREMETIIEWSPLESAQLFSGFRGTGKSTELRRLKRRLEESGAVVVLCDMQEYLNLHTPVDISDFLVAMAGAFGEALQKDPDLLGEDVIREGYWTRFWSFVKRARVETEGLGISPKVGDVGADLKANLKADPSFRRKLQARLEGHLGALVADVHAFFQACIRALRDRYGEDCPFVLLLDSVESVRGTALNAGEVTASLEVLFQGHAERLHIENLHVVYTVPPWLKIKTPGLAGLYRGAWQIPCVKVQDRSGARCQPGLDVLERLVRERGDWSRLFDSREKLDTLLLASGGYLRDLFRLLQAVLRLCRIHGLPASDRVVDLALHEVRNSYLPLTHADARWLAHIQRTHATQLQDGERLHDLSRFFDTHLVLTYRNGEEWWSVHPLIVDAVERQAAESEDGSTPVP